MGTSKPRFVTSAADKLIEEHTEEFSADFEENKKVVKKYVESSSAMINKVAGAITVRKKKAKKK